jgi:hypothetical protein
MNFFKYYPGQGLMYEKLLLHTKKHCYNTFNILLILNAYLYFKIGAPMRNSLFGK